MKGRSLRQAINLHGKKSIIEPCARRTWKQQVTLCSVKNCHLWRARHKSIDAFLEPVLRSLETKISISYGLDETFG